MRHGFHFALVKQQCGFDDAGSTTTKAALVAEDGSLLYSFYSNNNGSPLKTTIRAVKEICAAMPEGAKILGQRVL